MQLLNTIRIVDPGSLISTSLQNIGQFFQFAAIFEVQHRKKLLDF